MKKKLIAGLLAGIFVVSGSMMAFAQDDNGDFVGISQTSWLDEIGQPIGGVGPANPSIPGSNGIWIPIPTIPPTPTPTPGDSGGSVGGGSLPGQQRP